MHSFGNTNLGPKIRLYALSRVTLTLHTLQVLVTGFGRLKEEYLACPDFRTIFKELTSDPNSQIEYTLEDEYLFLGS